MFGGQDAPKSNDLDAALQCKVIFYDLFKGIAT